jgi:hypothetical protein
MTEQIISQTRLRVYSRNSDFWTVAAFSMIGILVMLNLMLSKRGSAAFLSSTLFADKGAGGWKACHRAVGSLSLL